LYFVKRTLICLSIMAIALAGCGGGGGGSAPTPSNVLLSGYVFDAAGNPIDEALVALTISARSPVSTSTDSMGKYAIQVPTGVNFSLAVSKTGITTKTLTGLRIDGGQDPTMDICINASAPPAGSTIHIVPSDSRIYVDEEKYFSIEVRKDGSVVTSAYPWIADILITGSGTGGLVPNDFSLFKVKGLAGGDTLNVKAVMKLQGGGIATASMQVNVETILPPPPPPM